jgi:hypothetical protein
MKYRSKINEFEVWQWKGYNHDDREGLCKFLNDATYDKHCYNSGTLVIYPYNDTPFSVCKGDYIIKDTMGSFFPVPQDMFEKMFEKIR